MDNEDKTIGYQFIPFPTDLYDLIISMKLSKRELSFVLLIARLTYGCKSHKWARIRQCDLRTIGINETHAKKVIETTLITQVVVQNQKTKMFRINEEYLRSELTKTVSFRLETLSKLVGVQLNSSSYQNGNEKLTEMVSQPFPKEEVHTSLNGNLNYLLKQEVSRSHKSDFSSTKDILIEKINSDK